MAWFQKNVRREPMAKVDTAWLRMESPTNLMMITGVMMFAEPLSRARLIKRIEQRFLAYRRFRQRPEEGATQTFWVEPPELDLDWHVQRLKLSDPNSEQELQTLAGELASTPLDHLRPLWRFHLVEKYGSGSALIMRIHHCYADGIALVQVMLSLTDQSRNASASEATTPDLEPSLLRRLLDVREAQTRVMKVARTAGKAVDALSQPSRLVEEGKALGKDLMTSLSLLPDASTSLKQPLSPEKRVGWCKPLPLEEVKAVAKAYGCSVNDLLITLFVGVLHRHFAATGEARPTLYVRATVPVNLRPLEHSVELGNRFGLVFLDLPVGESNPVARLYLVRDAMNEIKSSRQAMVAYGLLAVLGNSPAAVQQPALDLLSHKATCVLTNVPGPQQPMYFAGSKIDEIMFWVPQSGNIGVGISILSYAGKVHVGLMADANIFDDPGALVGGVPEEFDRLVHLSLLWPWHDRLSPADARAVLEQM